MKKLLILISTFISFSFAQSQENLEFVRVSYSEPIYEYITIKRPIQECYEEEYHERVGSSNNSIGLDTIIGATAGVVIGNQIGNGNGRTAAKIVGGLLGGKIANELRGSTNNSYETKYRTRCVTKYEDKKRKKVIKAYKNYFTYDGVEYAKVTNEPLKRVKITKTITF
ncbi:glycine zipper 2TM domain-containing protein [Malaciobacter mytili]|uniref:glycine zipper 2TM domain-containing protein n=1 Tax=Malaciobacter mytili TaxID=603050 RepID=UPI003A89B906